MYMWSAKSIVYNVITRVAVAVNYSCAMDSNGNMKFSLKELIPLRGEFTTNIEVVPFFPGFFGG